MMLNRNELLTAGLMIGGTEVSICGQTLDENPIEIRFDESDKDMVKRIFEITHGERYTPDWISVKDELPRLMQSVLYFDGTIDAGWYGAKKVFMNYDTCREVSDVQYWMPLPDPPVED